MKTSIKAFAIAAVLVLFSISNSFGAQMWYLKITGASGKSQIVQIKCPDGSCATTVTGVEPGKNTFALCDAQGRLMKAKEKANRTKCACSFTYTCTAPRDAATGLSTGKIAATTTELSSVSSPRDVATGQSTGRRQYNPVIIRKVVDDDERTLVMTGDVDGDSFTFQKIEWTWTDGGKSAMDDWSTN